MDLLDVISAHYEAVEKEIHNRGLFTMAIITAKSEDNIELGVGFAKRSADKPDNYKIGEELALRRAMTDLTADINEGEDKTEIPKYFLKSSIFSNASYTRHTRGNYTGIVIKVQSRNKENKVIEYTGIGIAKKHRMKNNSSGKDIIKSVAERRAMEDLFRGIQEGTAEDITS
jgi:hypothetical protein